MIDKSEFLADIRQTLAKIDPDVLAYNTDDFRMVQSLFEYVEFIAVMRRYRNTLLALYLARGLHDGSYRKSKVIRDGVPRRMPYLVHPLKVCRLLINIWTPLSKEQTDILLAAALCHDMLEDLDFPLGGRELSELYGLDPRVCETVKKVTKRKDFTREEELAHFHIIESDPLALLIKLSDRGNNVEDLYNMSHAKVQEYVGETRDLILPMCAFARRHYPELVPAVEILQEKITTLTIAAEALSNRYDSREQELRHRLDVLREENARLRAEWQVLKDYDAAQPLIGG